MDLFDMTVDQVYSGGRLVAEAGRMVSDLVWPASQTAPPAMRIDPQKIDLRVEANGTRMRVIEIIPDQLVTRTGIARAAVRDDLAVADPKRDLLKIAVIERHRGIGRTGIGFLRGMGLRQGAIASSVAHDAHNIVVVGANDEDMRTAVGSVVAMGGGLAIVSAGDVLASLALPIAGLMSPAPIAATASQMDALLAAAQKLGTSLTDPFMTLSFLALPVIPALKITDHGLVDVDRFAVVPLFISETGDDVKA